MAWTPKEQVLDLTPIIDNLLGYIEANDADALAWANGGDAMDEFAGLYPNASGRLATKFPQLIVLDQEIRVQIGGSENEGDILIGTLALTLEGAVMGKDVDPLVQDAKVRAKAVESMLMNIPLATLAAGCSPAITSAVCMGYQTAHDQVKGQGGKSASSWLQIWQTRAEYQLTADAFR